MSDARSIVDQTVLGEQFNDLVIGPVIDAVRVAVDEIDDLVLADQPPHCGFEALSSGPPKPHEPLEGRPGRLPRQEVGFIRVRLIHDLRTAIGAHDRRPVVQALDRPE
jgi:hypothetical protein